MMPWEINKEWILRSYNIKMINGNIDFIWNIMKIQTIIQHELLAHKQTFKLSLYMNHSRTNTHYYESTLLQGVISIYLLDHNSI